MKGLLLAAAFLALAACEVSRRLAHHPRADALMALHPRDFEAFLRGVGMLPAARRDVSDYPTPQDFDAMTPAEFDAYVERIGFGARIRASLAELHGEARWTRSLDELPTADEDGVTWAGS